MPRNKLSSAGFPCLPVAARSKAVEAVCDTKGDLGLDMLDGMASMVDKSLAQQVEQVDAETRFFMLSTIREYALERLAESNDESAARRAHAAYYLVLAEEGAEDVVAHPEWLDRFEIEHDNFRLALDYLIKTGDAEWGLRLGAALFRFWETREHLTEGRDAIARLLALEGAAARPKLRARLLSLPRFWRASRAIMLPRNNCSKRASRPVSSSTITAALRSR